MSNLLKRALESDDAGFTDAGDDPTQDLAPPPTPDHPDSTWSPGPSGAYATATEAMREALRDVKEKNKK